MDTTVFTLAEAAEFLKVSQHTLRADIKRGRLKAFHKGSRSVKISRPDLEAYWSKHGGGNLFSKTDSIKDSYGPAEDE